MQKKQHAKQTLPDCSSDVCKRVHLAGLRRVLQRARENGIKLILIKLKLMRNSVQYAGHTLTDKGIAIDPEKKKGVLKMPEPESINKVQLLLGMVKYIC